jgi:hypothetical protein
MLRLLCRANAWCAATRAVEDLAVLAKKDLTPEQEQAVLDRRRRRVEAGLKAGVTRHATVRPATPCSGVPASC